MTNDQIGPSLLAARRWTYAEDTPRLTSDQRARKVARCSHLLNRRIHRLRIGSPPRAGSRSEKLRRVAPSCAPSTSAGWSGRAPLGTRASMKRFAHWTPRSASGCKLQGGYPPTVQRGKPIAAAPHYRVRSAYGGTQRTEQLRQPEASCRWPFFNRCSWPAGPPPRMQMGAARSSVGRELTAPLHAGRLSLVP